MGFGVEQVQVLVGGLAAAIAVEYCPCFAVHRVARCSLITIKLPFEA